MNDTVPSPPNPIRLFTIGFTKKTAEEFFTKLETSGVKRLVDIRLNNISQLAGFPKRDDLRFFLKRIVHIEYVHEPLLAPTQDLLDAFKKEKGPWSDYESKFLSLMAQRHIETTISPSLLHQSCMLCSEDTPEHCHRRLVAEYLKARWPNVTITHIL
jgi:uncharacterized protein (DUF488 family)